ncbi:hypothetical protein IMZ48_25205 [Candidatus Bathyarchaeota archaeon]|nr:hypothetical protein [Candidatus Bathyarchaeota archaeon]
MTGYIDAGEIAHVVPLSAGHWFISNGMARLVIPLAAMARLTNYPNHHRYCRLAFDHLPINDRTTSLLSVRTFTTSSTSGASS